MVRNYFITNWINKMKDEYIIINKSVLEKRIEELRQVCNKELGYASDKIYFELEHLLSQSTPLIPEIKKVYDSSWFKAHGVMANKEKEKQDYISNLKLDI